MEAEKKPFDIATLAAADEAELEIIDADGQRTGWKLIFGGPGHPATIEIENANHAKMVARDNIKEKAQTNGRKWKGDGETPEEKAARLRQESIDYIVARLLRWELPEGSAPFPCTPENARSVLGNRSMGLVYDQANAFLIDDRSFFKRSPRS